MWKKMASNRRKTTEITNRTKMTATTLDCSSFDDKFQ